MVLSKHNRDRFARIWLQLLYLANERDKIVSPFDTTASVESFAPEETRANLEKIIALAREKYPEVKIILAGMQMPSNMGAEYTKKFGALFADLAKEKKTELIPFVLEGVGGKAELNQPDRIHPNPEGHKIVAQNVWAVLEPMLKEVKSR